MIAALAALPDDALVLDVGGWAAPLARADWVIDVGPYETRNVFYRERGEEPPPGRVSAEQWVVADVCGPERWPFPDDRFDFVYCSQTLEDVRDPVFVCAEMARVGRAGLVLAPHPAIELTRGIESRLWCGWRHHRWLVDARANELVFVVKPQHVHNPTWPSVRSPKRLRPEALEPLVFSWHGSFGAREELFFDPDALDRRLLALAASVRLPDPAGDLATRSSALVRGSYAAARAAAGRLLRRSRRAARG